jgi:hypothetical protein
MYHKLRELSVQEVYEIVQVDLGHSKFGAAFLVHSEPPFLIVFIETDSFDDCALLSCSNV